MQVKHIVNGDGFHVESFTDSRVVDLGLFIIEAQIPNPNNFLILKWNFQNIQWEEGATLEEVNSFLRTSLLNELTDKCIYLTDRSIISSVSKEEKDLNYLTGQIDRYLKKYKVAKHYIDNSGEISNQIWYNQIVDEMNTTIEETNAPLTIPVFMSLIVQYYESGEEREQKFNAAIESFRCKTKDLIMTNQFDRARISLDLANSVPDTVSMELLDTLITQLNNI